ncbi:MAG: hypothetical protein PWQ91_917 [Eubacteriales bacterium]|nr:hypothetical protein [Eubacteriales bacterium]MDN5363856.1 hypothetical protein [Eubacteriales bacterium]
MKKKKPFGWRGLLFLFLLAAVVFVGSWQKGVVFAAGNDNPTGKEQYCSINDELIERHIKEKEKVEKGRKTFEDLLRQRGGRKPAYGSKEYWQILAEYADPEGKLRKQDPEKWELLDAYAYDYYVKNFLPPVKPERTGTSSGNGEKGISAASVTIQGGLYNRSGAVNYAYRYVGSASDVPFYKNYNPYYHAFSADCTNFVSQCLRAGGVPLVDAWWRPWFASGDWYYYRRGTDSFDSNNDDGWSWSWVKVQSLYYHITGRLGFQAYSSGQLQLGDIVQFDFNNDGILDHSAIVTSIDSRDGMRRVSYHTANRKDVRMDSEWLKDSRKIYLHITY